MVVKIKIGQMLQQYTADRETVEIKGTTVSSCLDDLTKQYPEIKKWLFDRNGILMVLILLNGKIVPQKALNKHVTDGDELELTFLVGGG